MQQIIVKTNNASQVVNQTQVVTKNGQPTVIKANGNANYEFVKENTGRAPDHIVTKRVGKDLHVSFEEAGQDSDLIIENFYNYQESALVGQAENGQYYYYIPDTGEVVDYVTQLNAGSIQGQALGGQNLVSPWWVASGLTSTGGLGSLPWLLGSTGAVAAVAHRQGKDDDERPAAYISIETVAKNDVVNVDERGTEVEVIGAVSGYYTPGDIVTLVINGKTYKTPVDATGSFTIKVPAEELSKDSDSIIEASVAATSPAGNFTASTMHRYAVEIVSPTAIHDPANQGGVIVRPDDQADRLIIDYTDEADQPQQITLSKDPSTGTWSPQGNLPVGVEVNPQTGEVTLSPDAIKDGSTLTAQNTRGTDTAPSTSVVADNDANQPPVANDDVAVTDYETAVTIDVLANDTDADNDPLTITQASVDPAQGTVSIDNGKLIFTPAAGFEGDATINYTISDGKEVSSAKVTTTVANAPVVSIAGSSQVNEGEQATYTLSLDKAHGKDVTVTVSFVAGTATDGDVVFTTQTVTIPAGATEASFTVAAVADQMTEGEEAYGVRISQVDGAKVGVAQADTTIVDSSTTPIPALESPTAIHDPANQGGVIVRPDDQADRLIIDYTDEADQPQQITLSKDPSTGTWSPQGNLPVGVEVNPQTGEVTLSPDAIKDGSTLTAQNTRGTDTAPSTSVVADNDANQPPVANDDVAVTDYETAVTIDVLANDTDADNDPLTITQASVDPAQGTVSIDNGKLIFTPAAGFEGDATINYTISDGKEVSSAKVTTTVANAPVVSIAGSSQVNEGEQATYTLSLDKAHGKDVTVTVSFVAGTATDGDVVFTTQTVTIPAGATEASFTVAAVADQMTEGEEAYGVRISQVDGAKVGVAQADTTIVDSSTTPNLAPSVVVTITITPEQGKAVAGQEVATSAGTDPEGEPLVYSLTPNSDPDGLYAINPQTGQVTLTQQGADHINAGHDLPVVQVTVTDPHGLTGQDNDNNVPSTIDVPAPATAPEVSIVKDADNNGYINADEKGTDTTTDVSILIPADAKDGDVVTVVDGNGVELVKYTVGQHGVVAGSTQTLTGVMLPNEGETLSVKAFITNVSGSLTGNTDSAIIDTIAPDANNLSIEIISIAGQDNVLNLSEAVITDKLIPVVGKVTGDFLPGNYVTVHVNGKYETVAVDDQGMFTAYFAGTELNADVDRVVEATILARDKAGNLTTKTADKMFTVETAIAPSIDDFTTLTNPIYVSEEGLKNGITDNQGSPDTTNSSVITGQFTFKDPDSSQLSLELEGLTTVQTLSGNDVAWQWDASSNTLKGTANGELVLTVEVAQPVLVSGDKFASDYTIKLHQPILHPVHGIEDVLNLDFNLKVSDGTSTTTGQFAIVVEDDMPSIEQNAHVDIVLQKQPAQTNLLVGFDVSSSMNSPAILDGKPATRLDVTQKALSDAIKQYDSGDNEVMVKMVLFGREANTVGNTWMTASDALAWIATLRDYADANINRGSTNYEDTLAKMMDAFAHPGKFTGSDANNVSIFLTDGHPNVSMGDNNGLSGTVNGGHDSPRISKAEEKVWTDWLKTNNIKSYAYSAHIGSDSSAIDPIAYDGKTSTDLDGLAATDTSGLAQNLTENTSISIQSVTATGDGSVFINDNTISGQFTGFGADGGYVSKVVIGGATYTFDGKDVTTPNGTMTNTSFVSINTPQGGKLVVDMATAKYSYTSAVNKSAYQEQMTYTVVDGDGDGVESKQTWNVVVKDVNGNTSINGKATLDVIDSSIKGLNGEYYGYNDQVVAGNKVHADDTKYGNLQTISDMEGIINGRNGADVVGTNASAHQGAPDARFTATTINYGNVRTSLGTNTSLASGETASTGGLTTSNSQLYKFLSKSNSDGNSIVAESGVGNTTDAGIRVTGNIYLEPGQYDFRVYSDDGFRLLLDGQSVIEYDNIRSPATSTATGVQIKGGLVPVELLYWEQGVQGVLHFEYKPSHETEWKTLDLSDTLMLRDNSLDLNILQDIVMVNDEWHVRTGDVISGTNPKDQEFITGTEAKDIIYGGKMNDTLVGGSGADLFVYNTQVDNDNDIIKDFTVGVDKIVLSDVIDVNAQNLGINLDNPAWAGKDSVSDMAWNDSTKTLSFKTADGGSNAITFENMTESYTDLDAFLKANAIL